MAACAVLCTGPLFPLCKPVCGSSQDTSKIYARTTSKTHTSIPPRDSVARQPESCSSTAEVEQGDGADSILGRQTGVWLQQGCGEGLSLTAVCV